MVGGEVICFVQCRLMTENSEHSVGVAPGLVLIVSNASIVLGDPAELGGRPCHHAVLQSPLLPLPALATTAATGVTPLVHGIVCAPQVDRDDLSLRAPSSADRCFPSFWTEAAAAGLGTMTIDWPASDDDPAITTAMTPQDINAAIQSADVESHPFFDTMDAPAKASAHRRQIGLFLSRADRAIAAAQRAAQSDTAPDAIAMVIRHSTEAISPQDAARYIEPKINAFLRSLPDSTTVVIVRKWASESSSSRALPYTLTICGQAHRASTIETTVSLASIGGAARQILNLPCPAGVAIPRWGFLDCQEESPNRPFPIGARAASTDWDDLVRRTDDLPAGDAREKVIRVLSREVAVLAVLAYAQQRWGEVAWHARSMIVLRGDPVDHWGLIDALHRGNDGGALAGAIQCLHTAHPNHAVTKLAQCIQLIGPAADKARPILAELDVASFPVNAALGTLGRLCLRANLDDQGRDAIEQSILCGVVTLADRVALAAHYLRTNRPPEAMAALAKIGIPPGKRQWCLLRLRILLSLGSHDGAMQHAEAMRHEWPADADVSALMSGR